MLDHPYPLGTRVRHAGDDSVGALATGTARIVEPVGNPGGELDYRVRTDTGNEDTWPAYFTIPVKDVPAGRHSSYPARPPKPEEPAPAEPQPEVATG